MKALFARRSRPRVAFWSVCLLGLAGSMTLVACDFNVEITDEKRSLEKIGGTSPCASGQRFSTGTSGSHTLRIFLIDDRQNPEALDLDGINREPFNFVIGSLAVATADDHDSARPKLIDAEDGTEVSGTNVTLSLVDDGDNSLLPVPNPRYSNLKRTSENKRVPKAVNLLIDMSETSADSDTSLSRTSAPAGWILENFNTDTTVGDLDVFSTLLVRSGVVSRSDLLFIGPEWEDDLQYIADDGRRRGFLLTTDDAKERISQTFTNISNNRVSGQPPAYAAIQAAAADTRLVARSEESGNALFNPGIIFVTLERDHSLIDKNTNVLPQATQALAGDPWDYPAEDAADGVIDEAFQKADFIPLMSVVYPVPEQTGPLTPFPPEVSSRSCDSRGVFAESTRRAA